jgi:hypothetical protein
MSLLLPQEPADHPAAVGIGFPAQCALQDLDRFLKESSGTKHLSFLCFSCVPSLSSGRTMNAVDTAENH